MCIPSQDNSSAAAGKQQETAGGTNEENQGEAKPKAKAKAKGKPQAKVFLRVSSPTSTCMTTVTSKKVRFSKFSQKKSVRDNKQSTSKRWDLIDNLSDFKPKMTNPDGTINFPEDWKRGNRVVRRMVHEESSKIVERTTSR